MARHLSPEEARKIGAKGGRATKRRYGEAYLRELAKKGGDTTLARYGVDHLKRAGRAGYDAMIQKYFDGDEAAFLQWFTAYGQWVQDPFPANQAFTSPGEFPRHHPRGHMEWDEWESVWLEHWEA